MMGIVSHQIKGNTCSASGSFEFAFLKDIKELILRTIPAFAGQRDDLISLKNGVYRIEEGVLYIKATRIYFGYLPDYCEKEDVWSPRAIYWPDEKFLLSLENPPKVKEVIIKRWWRNNKKIQAIELSEDDPRWYKAKTEHEFEIAISNFVLNESIIAKK